MAFSENLVPWSPGLCSLLEKLPKLSELVDDTEKAKRYDALVALLPGLLSALLPSTEGLAGDRVSSHSKMPSVQGVRLDVTDLEAYTLSIARKAASIALESAFAEPFPVQRKEGTLLDNHIEASHNEPLFVDQEGNQEMASYSGYRERVRIGTDEKGAPAYTWACGLTRELLHENIVRIYVERGLISKFYNGSSVEVKMESEIVESNGILFGDYATGWLLRYKETSLEQTTLSGYKSYLRKHLLPAFGDMNLLEISIDDIQDFMNDRQELAAKTIRELLVLLRQILEAAVEDNIIPKNPAKSKRLKNPSAKVTIREAIPLDKFLGIVAQIVELEERDRRLMALLLFTGMRRGEVLGMKWEDIDFDNMLINVRRSVTYPSNQPLIKTPKTKNGFRQIPLDPVLISMLAATAGSKGFIIGGDAPISLTSYRNTYARIEKQVTLYDATAHIFRHSYLTLLDEADVDSTSLTTIAGHGNDSFTRKRYIHWRVKGILSAGEKFAALVSANETFQALVGNSEKYRSLLSSSQGEENPQAM